MSSIYLFMTGAALAGFLVAVLIMSHPATKQFQQERRKLRYARSEIIRILFKYAESENDLAEKNPKHIHGNPELFDRWVALWKTLAQIDSEKRKTCITALVSVFCAIITAFVALLLKSGI